jgi:hypothetical protein
MAMSPITRPSRRPSRTPKSDFIPPSAWNRCLLRSTHDPHRLSQPVLRIARHSGPFRGSAIVPAISLISFFLSRALNRCLPLYTRDTRAFLKWTILAHSAECGRRGSLFHRSAWKVNSAKSRCRTLHSADPIELDRPDGPGPVTHPKPYRSSFPEVRIAPARYLWACWTGVLACDVILTSAVTQGGGQMCHSP